MSIIDQPHEGIIQYYGANGVHCPGAYRYFTIQTLQPSISGQLTMQNLNVANAVTMYSATNNYTQFSSIDLFPDGTINIHGSSATLDNVTVWSANSILTRDYADARYAPVSALIDGGTALSTSTGSFDGGSAIAN